MYVVKLIEGAADAPGSQRFKKEHFPRYFRSLDDAIKFKKAINGQAGEVIVAIEELVCQSALSCAPRWFALI